MKIGKKIGKVVLAMFLSVYALALLLGILFVLGMMYVEVYMYEP